MILIAFRSSNSNCQNDILFIFNCKTPFLRYTSTTRTTNPHMETLRIHFTIFTILTENVNNQSIITFCHYHDLCTNKQFHFDASSCYHKKSLICQYFHSYRTRFLAFSQLNNSSLVLKSNSYKLHACISICIITTFKFMNKISLICKLQNNFVDFILQN